MLRKSFWMTVFMDILKSQFMTWNDPLPVGKPIKLQLYLQVCKRDGITHNALDSFISFSITSALNRLNIGSCSFSEWWWSHVNLEFSLEVFHTFAQNMFPFLTPAWMDSWNKSVVTFLTSCVHHLSFINSKAAASWKLSSAASRSSFSLKPSGLRSGTENLLHPPKEQNSH